MLRSVTWISLCGLLAAFSAAAETWSVQPDGSGDWPTIQAAIAAADAGDVIELGSGVFQGSGNRDLDCLGKAITIRSASGDPAACILECAGLAGDPHRAFTFQTNETLATCIEAITIRNGHAPSSGLYPFGGGILCLTGASPTITGCIFVGCQAVEFEGQARGGAIGSIGGPTITDCIFAECTADRGGALAGTFLEIHGCTIYDCSAHVSGGAFYCDAPFGEYTLDQCTIVACGAPTGGALAVPGCSVMIENSIVAFGTAGGVVWQLPENPVTSRCCNTFGNAGGNDLPGEGHTVLDPRFCDLAARDLTLQASSPCAPEANPLCGLVGAWPIGCEDTPVVPTSWGALKAKFRAGLPVPAGARPRGSARIKAGIVNRSGYTPARPRPCVRRGRPPSAMDELPTGRALGAHGVRAGQA